MAVSRAEKNCCMCIFITKGNYMMKYREINSKIVKRYVKRLGADLVGISSMDRFEGAPKQNDARYIFPGAKSMIVLGFRIARGTLRGIEEGTLFSTYSSMGYAALNQIYAPMVLWNMTRFLEDAGYETVPMMNTGGGEAINSVTGNFRRGWSRPIRKDKPYPDVLVHFRLAAYMAGLGEIGWSKVFLTPEFGPRQRFALLLTDAELEPDPVYEGKICDRCMQCVKNCTGRAISPNESVKVTIAGHEIEWGKLDPLACEKGIQGGINKELNPFEGEYPRFYGYGRAIEGGCGCIRACMIHLEERCKIKNLFKNKFRTEKQWKIDRSKRYELTPEVIEFYEKNGMIEDYDVYIKYNETDNYGTKRKTENQPFD
jgi:epoxyqueuosine reductase QueG